MENESVFVEFFGKEPRVRILECFLEGRELDFGAGDIARELELNRVTVYQVMYDLEKELIIIPTRKVGKGQLYKLNLQNENVQLMVKAFNAILHGIAEIYAEQQPQKIMMHHPEKHKKKLIVA